MINVFLSIVFVAGIFYVIYQHHKDKPETVTDGQQAATGQDNTPLNQEQIERSLDRFNLWIDNCDQKASVLLAIVGVATTLFFTSDAIKMLRTYIFQPIVQGINTPGSVVFSPSRFWVLLFFMITAVLLLVTLLFLIRTIRPNLDYKKMQEENPGMEKKTILFYKSVANMTYEQYKTTAVNYLNDLRSQAYTNAKIATNKFNYFQHAIFYFALTVISASLLFVAVMFMK